MGALRVLFEMTSLEDVRRVATTGTISHRGDAGESEYWLCYTRLGANPVQRVWVTSSGEMGGRQHFVTNVSATVLPNGAATTECPPLPKRLEPLSLKNYLWLGTTRKQVTTKLGTPSFQQGGWSTYDYEGKVAGNCEGSEFDLSASLLLHFRNGRVTALQIGQITSC